MPTLLACKAQSKRDEAARARQNQRFARKQAAREHDSRLVAALAERSKAALKRCQAAEKKVRACARAAKLAAGDARHIEGLVREWERRLGAAKASKKAEEEKRDSGYDESEASHKEEPESWRVRSCDPSVIRCFREGSSERERINKRGNQNLKE